jgi:hypothetical protein
MLEDGGFFRLRGERSENEQVEKTDDFQAYVSGIECLSFSYLQYFLNSFN